MNYTLTNKMTRDEWVYGRFPTFLDGRGDGGYLGASEWAGALGKSMYQTPLDVYLSKVERRVLDDTLPMRLGRDIEPVIAKWFVEETGLQVRNDNKIRYHKDHPYLATNLDRVVVLDDGLACLEIKTVGEMAFKAWQSDFPLHYKIQIQGQMEITGYPYCYVAMAIWGMNTITDFKIMKFERDPEFFNAIRPYLVDFWENRVLHLNPPKPINSDDLKETYPFHKDGESINATDAILNDMNDLALVKEKIKELKAEQKSLEFNVKDFIGHAEILTNGENILATWKASNGRKTFDKKTFGSEHPELLDQYTTEGNPYRTLRIK